jgi:hypothetical protein
MSNKELSKTTATPCDKCDAIEYKSNLAGPGTVIYEVLSNILSDEGIHRGDLITVVLQNHAEEGMMVIAEVEECIRIRRIVHHREDSERYQVQGIIVGRLHLYNRGT